MNAEPPTFKFRRAKVIYLGGPHFPPKLTTTTSIHQLSSIRQIQDENTVYN